MSILMALAGLPKERLATSHKDTKFHQGCALCFLVASCLSGDDLFFSSSQVPGRKVIGDQNVNTARTALKEGWAAIVLTVLLVTGVAAVPEMPRTGAQNTEPFKAELVIRA